MVSGDSGGVFQSGTVVGRNFRISRISDKTGDTAENVRVRILVSVFGYEKIIQEKPMFPV